MIAARCRICLITSCPPFVAIDVSLSPPNEAFEVKCASKNGGFKHEVLESANHYCCTLNCKSRH